MPSADRVAVVTGAGRGMGREIARVLASDGLRVVAIARTEADLAETANTSSGRLITPRPLDVSRSEDVEQAFAAIAAEYGRVDVLVCSHGIYQGGFGALEIPLEQFDRTLAVNLRASLHCAQLAGRLMRSAGEGGHIVFISSINGLAAQGGAVDYDTSKAALNGLTRALAVELAPSRIAVNAIAPGWIRTPMSEEELLELEGGGLVMNPSHRVGDPAEVALAVRWLTDVGNRYTTGAVIPVDGGQLAMLPIPWRPDQTVL